MLSRLFHHCAFRFVVWLSVLTWSIVPVATAQSSDDSAPIITQQPSNLTVSDGYFRSIGLYASGSPAPTYQWQRQPGGTGAWADVPEGFPFRNTQSNFLSIDVVSLAFSGDRFRCIVSNRAGSVTSNEVTLTVTPTAPSFSGFLGAQNATAGSTVQFAPNVSGTAPLSYQWRKNGTPIPDAIGATLTLTNVQLADQGNYSVVVTNTAGSATSNNAALQIIVPPVITSPPQPATKAIGESVTFSVNYTSVTSPSIQWLRDGEALAGATSSSLQLTNLQATDAGFYQVRLTNAAGQTFSTAVELLIVPAPAPTIPTPANTTFPAAWGGSVTLTAPVASITASTYQWYRDGQLLPGATLATLTLSNVGAADFADYYFTATNASGTTLSPTLRVVPLPEGTSPAHHWIDAREVDGVVYFTFADTPRILRYDIAAGSWLPPWTLPATPVAVAFAPDALYLATTNQVTRYDRDFTSPAVIWNSATAILHLGVFDDVLVVAALGNYTVETRVSTCQRQTGQLIAQQTYTYTFSGDFTFDPIARTLAGRDRTGGSSVYDFRVLPIEADGTLGTIRSTGLSTNPGRTWVLRAASLLGQVSGHVVDLATMTRVSSLGFGADDAIPRAGGYYTLQAGRVREMDGQFRELRTHHLGFRGARLWQHNGSLFVFSQPASSGATPLITQLTPDDFSAVAPAAPVNAAGLALPSPQIETDDEGAIHVWSRFHQNIFRWSSRTGTYGEAVGLAARPNVLALDPTRRRVVFERDDHQVDALDLSSTTASAAPFHRSTGVVSALTPAGALLAVSARNSDTDAIFSGAMLSALDDEGAVRGVFGGSPSHHVWSAALQRLYYLRTGSPPDLHYVTLAPDGSYVLGSGESPYHDDAWTQPVRPSPDGAWISLGNGRIIRGADLTQVGYIARAHVDAAWSEDRLHTIRPALGGTTVETWSVPQLTLVNSVTLPGSPLRILRLKADRLLVATSQSGVPAFRVLAAPTLASIAATDHAAPPEILRQSSLIAGAAGGAAAFWVETGGGVLPDYRWQMRPAGSTDWVEVEDDANFTGSRTARLAIAALAPSHAGARFRVVVSNPGGTTTSDAGAVSVAGPAAVTQAVVSDGKIYFVRADGSAWRASSIEPAQIDSSVAYLTGNATGVAWFKSDGSAYQFGEGAEFLVPGQQELQTLPRRLDRVATLVTWGWAHRLLLDRDGYLWGGGGSDQGQLGSFANVTLAPRLLASSVVGAAASGSTTWYVSADGTLSRMGHFLGSSSAAPQVVDTGVAHVVADSHVVYVKQDGTAWALGSNTSGQLGDGTTTDRATPVLLATNVRSAAVGSSFTLLLKTDGTVWATGSNTFYQFGDGTTLASLTPRQVASGATAIAAGWNTSVLLRADGSLWFAGRLNGTDYRAWTKLAEGLAPSPPVAPAGLSVSSVSGAALISWAPVLGARSYEILRGTSDEPAAATLLAGDLALPIFADATAVSGVDYHYFVRAVTPGGVTDLAAAGTGRAGTGLAPVITEEPADLTVFNSGVLRIAANADPAPQYQWQQSPPGETTWSDVPDAYPHIGATIEELRLQWFAPDRSGTRFRCVVSNSFGSVTSREAVVTVHQPTVITTQPLDVTVTQGGSTSIGLWVFGDNLTYEWRRNGALLEGATENFISIIGSPDTAGTYTVRVIGDGGTVESAPAIVTVIPAPAATAIGAGSNFSVILLANGHVRGMGANSQRQIGLGSFTARIDPPAEETVSNPLISVSSGPNHTLFVSAGGALSAGGNNTYHQTLGNWGVGFSQVSNVATAAAGGYHTLYVRKDGTAWAVGLNSSGQLGDSSTTNRTTAVQVLTDVIDVAAGGAHSLFIKADGSLWATGNNDYGQLGLGGTTSRSAPAQVTTQVKAAAAGDHYTLFLKTDGTLWGMGLNAHGEFGSAVGLNQRAETPVQIASDVVRFAAGGGHIAWITSDGKLWVRGRNGSGQLGTGDTTARTTAFQLAAHATLVAAGTDHTLFADASGAVWVVGANQSGQLGLGSTASFVLQPTRLWETAPTVPAPVTTLFASDGTVPGAVRLSWDAGVGSTSYEIWRATSPSLAAASLLVADVRTPMHYDTTVVPGTLYYYWVRGRNASGVGEFQASDAGIASTATGLPSMFFQPTDQNVFYGSATSISVNVTSATSVTYQWRKNGVPISGATFSSLQLSSATFDTAGLYDVLITNTAGTIASRLVKITVTRGLQWITLPSLPNRIFTAEPFAAGPATSSVGLPITYTVTSGPATISGNQLTLTGVGTVHYTASQEGNDFYGPAQSVSRHFEVSPAPAELEFGNLLRIYDGQPHAVTVNSTPTAEHVIITYNGQPTPPTAAGRYTVVASVADPFALGSRVGLLTILPAAQQITFAPPEVIRDDRPLTLAASATSGLPVAFSIDLGPANLTDNTLTPSGVGNVIIRAHQTGDANHDAALLSRTIRIVETFPTWRAARFSTAQHADLAISGPSADPDHDGYRNLLEYALGTDPLTPDSISFPAISLMNENGTSVWDYHYTRAADRLDLTYTVERSTDLMQWTTDDILHEPTPAAHTWRGRYSPSIAPPRIFFRLKVTTH